MLQRKLILTLTLLVAGTLAFGCGSSKKRVEGTETPKKVAKAEKISKDSYTVEKSDTLWGIAGKSEVYSDSFQWPLIFKANRDSIKDPDLIYPKQNFTITKGHSAEEVANAKNLAMKTPKYVPHSKPRDSFGVDYF